MHPSGSSNQPPQTLVELAERTSHPGVLQCGLTVTPEGAWALYVVLTDEVKPPLPDLDAAAAPYPVLYCNISEIPVARPAYPDQGE